VRLLHTSDWHVGKAIRGHSRADEHRAVLAEIVSIAESEAVDLIIVAGDLFETAAPSPEAEGIVYDAFLGLAGIAPVVAVAGNHDNPRRLEAVAPLLRLGRVTMLTTPVGPADGGVIEFALTDGTPVRIALLPFVSQRGIVRAEQLMNDAAYELAQTYSDRLRQVVAALTSGFSGDAINLVVAHAFVQGGAVGGGERAAHLVDEYSLPAIAFPATASYVALGHLHRPQAVKGATAMHYSGSPLQLDFGEEQQTKQVNIVDVEVGLPAKVRAVPLTAGRGLRTIAGSLEQLRPLAATVGDDWLRVRVNEPSRPGLADDVREMLGDGVVDVTVDFDRPTVGRQAKRRDGRSPVELFNDYLADSEVVDARLSQGFATLLEDASHLQEVET
jgi:exonuclease SbcD